MLSSLLSLICHLTRRSSRLVPDPIKTRQTNYIWHRNNSVCSSLETSCLALHQILWRSNIHRTVVFWQQIANKSGGESGLTFYSGWITAFCFWGKDGKCKYQLPSSRLNNSKSLEHSWDDDWSSHYLRLDEIISHQVQSNKVPSQFSSVAVKVDDNGAFFDTLIVAGSVRMHCSSSGSALAERREGLVQLARRLGGWYLKQRARPQNSEGKAKDMSRMQLWSVCWFFTI